MTRCKDLAACEMDRVGFEVWVSWQGERDDYAGRLALELRRTGRLDCDSVDRSMGLAEFERFMSVEGVREWNMLPDAERDRARRLFNTVGCRQVWWCSECRQAEKEGRALLGDVRQLVMF